MSNYSDILMKPVVTEKSNTLGEELGRFTFIVDKRANKIQIKNAVEEMYGVQVTAVNTINMPAKAKVRNTRAGVSFGKTAAVKKAVVTLVEGDTIDFYSNI